MSSFSIRSIFDISKLNNYKNHASELFVMRHFNLMQYLVFYPYSLHGYDYCAIWWEMDLLSEDQDMSSQSVWYSDSRKNFYV